MSHQIQEKSKHFLGKCNVKCLKIKLQASIFWCAARVTYVQVTLRINCQSKNLTLKGNKPPSPQTFPSIKNSLLNAVETERFLKSYYFFQLF